MSGLPKVTVIVPTYSRPEQLDGCLAALAGLDYPRDRVDVIVVDDGSPGGVADVVGRHTGGELQMALVTTPNRGPGAARNAGAESARGSILAFTDDDCRPDPGWLKPLIAALADEPELLVGGRTENALIANPYSAAAQIILEVVYAHYNEPPERARFLASNNIAVAATAFASAAGFDARFRLASEDRELCDRWLHLGRRIRYVPAAVVRHRHALSLASFAALHFRYGRGAARFHAVRAARGAGGLGRELRFHSRFLALLRAPLGRVAPGPAVRLAALLVMWQIVNAAGYLYERGRLGDEEAP